MMAWRIGACLLVAVGIITFALAAIYDTFAGDVTLLEALRFESESWRDFFAQFDASPLASVMAVLLMAAILWIFRKRWESLATLLILPVQALIILLPKWAIGRPRPEGELVGNTDSFPSGTAATSILVLGLAIYFVGVFVAPRRLRIALQLLLGMAILALGIFRVLAGEHWPSDILGGYLAGGLGLMAIIWLYHKLQVLRDNLKLGKAQSAMAGR